MKREALEAEKRNPGRDKPHLPTSRVYPDALEICVMSREDELRGARRATTGSAINLRSRVITSIVAVGETSMPIE
jgi:hypothetical protein